MPHVIHVFAGRAKIIRTFAVILAILLPTSHAVAGEEFGIEERFPNLTDVPVSVATDMEKNLDAAGNTCLAEGKTTAKGALEATRIDLGNSARALLLKPKPPAEPQAAWGCFCGAYTCPMWIYSFEGTSAHRIWSSGGVSLEVVDRKDNGAKRLLLSSGSAGHQEVTLYAWDGREYTVLREKSVLFGQGGDVDERAQKELDKFRNGAIH